MNTTLKASFGTVTKDDNKIIIAFTDGNYEGIIKNKESNNINEGLRQAIETLILIGLGITYFNTDITIVDGRSMYPTYNNLQVIVKSKCSKTINKLMLNRNTIIKFKDTSNVTSIKLIVGVPGDVIEFDLQKIKKNGHLIDDNNSEEPPPGSVKQTSYTKLGKPRTRSAIATLTLKENEYFVMGDNKNNSLDSRNYGPIKDAAILSIIKK